MPRNVTKAAFTTAGPVGPRSGATVTTPPPASEERSALDGVGQGVGVFL